MYVCTLMSDTYIYLFAFLFKISSLLFYIAAFQLAEPFDGFPIGGFPAAQGISIGNFKTAVKCRYLHTFIPLSTLVHIKTIEILAVVH